MLDPFTALSVASSVIQFVDFGIKLVSEGIELYEKGSLTGNDELELVTRDLNRVTHELVDIHQASTPSADHLALQELAASCKGIGSQLISILESLKTRQSNPSGLESFRKALRNARNKGKIEDLEERLRKLQAQLNTRLLAILSNNQSTVMSTLNRIAEENKSSEMKTSSELGRLRLELLNGLKQPKTYTFVKLGETCLQLAEEGETIATRIILNSLYFKDIRERQEAIKDTHMNTMMWIFRNQAEGKKPNPRFLQWLKRGDGIYWVSGKAGSGKSTLMKLMCDHELTQDALRVWAGSKQLVTASFFFWSPGNSMQKSQSGLLQSLLYQILRQRTDLIWEVCSSRWMAARADSLYNDHPDRWSRQELSEAFEKLAKQNLSTTKFCFFVDGLDEYDGEHLDIIQTLQNLAESGYVKLCVSSRPWNVFETAFGDDTSQKLLLQDFTKDDIRVYVKNNLEENKIFSKLMKQDDQYKQLIEEIVDRARGVFLWVYLVVRSLLRGLVEGDDIIVLWVRLDSLPRNLEEYFQKMLDSIEDVYQDETARIFQVMVHKTSPLSYINLRESARKHLNARCKDLIEINTRSQGGNPDMLCYQVDFLHRTVRDFLMTKDMQNDLRNRTASGFDAKLSLCRISLAHLKTLPSVPASGSIKTLRQCAPQFVRELISYAHELELHNRLPQVDLLKDLESVLIDYISHPGNRDLGLFGDYTKHDFLLVCVMGGLYLYVGQILEQNPQLQRVSKLPLLQYALGILDSSGPKLATLRPSWRDDYGIDFDMVQLLLERGADPNQVSEDSGYTPWQIFLLDCYKNKGKYIKDMHGQYQGVFAVATLFMSHGADRDLKIRTEYKTKKNQTTYSPPLDVLEELLEPDQLQYINELIRKQDEEKQGLQKQRGWGLRKMLIG